MQTVRGWRRGNQAKVYEDFNPSMDWTQDSSSHILIIDLPGFKRDDLKVQIDDIRKLSIYGERQVAGDKYKRFKNIVTMPQDSDIAKISAKFEQGILFITMPKIMPKSTDKKPELPAVEQEKETAPNVVEKLEEAPTQLVAPDQKKEHDKATSEDVERSKKDGGDSHEEPQLSKAVDPEKEAAPKLIEKIEEAPKEIASDLKKEIVNARSEAMEKINEGTGGDIDKEPQLAAPDPEKEAASELVERKEDKPKEVAPDQKKEYMTREAVEEMKKDGEGIHDQKVIETQKEDNEGGHEKNQKEEIARSDHKGMKTVGKCRVREDDGSFAEKIKKRMRIALGWIGEKVKGGVEMEEEGVGKLLDVAKKNKEVITAALVAFTIGFYVSKKLNR